MGNVLANTMLIELGISNNNDFWKAKKNEMHFFYIWSSFIPEILSFNL
jgi:hypothetical protein